MQDVSKFELFFGTDVCNVSGLSNSGYRQIAAATLDPKLAVVLA